MDKLRKRAQLELDEKLQPHRVTLSEHSGQTAGTRHRAADRAGGTTWGVDRKEGARPGGPGDRRQARCARVRRVAGDANG
jgi:hypothetical protein